MLLLWRCPFKRKKGNLPTRHFKIFYRPVRCRWTVLKIVLTKNLSQKANLISGIKFVRYLSISGFKSVTQYIIDFTNGIDWFQECQIWTFSQIWWTLPNHRWQNTIVILLKYVCIKYKFLFATNVIVLVMAAFFTPKCCNWKLVLTMNKRISGTPSIKYLDVNAHTVQTVGPEIKAIAKM